MTPMYLWSFSTWVSLWSSPHPRPQRNLPNNAQSNSLRTPTTSPSISSRRSISIRCAMILWSCPFLSAQLLMIGFSRTKDLMRSNSRLHSSNTRYMRTPKSQCTCNRNRWSFFNWVVASIPWWWEAWEALVWVALACSDLLVSEKWRTHCESRLLYNYECLCEGEIYSSNMVVCLFPIIHLFQKDIQCLW